MYKFYDVYYVIVFHALMSFSKIMNALLTNYLLKNWDWVAERYRFINPSWAYEELLMRKKHHQLKEIVDCDVANFGCTCVCVIVVAWLIIGLRVFENATMPFWTRLDCGPFVHPVGERTFSSLLPSVGLSLCDIVYRDKIFDAISGTDAPATCMCNSRFGTFVLSSFYLLYHFICGFTVTKSVQLNSCAVKYDTLSFNFELNNA